MNRFLSDTEREAIRQETRRTVQGLRRIAGHRRFCVDGTAPPWQHGAMDKKAKPLKGDRVRTTFHLPEELYVALRVRAARDRGLSMSGLAIRYIEAGLRAEGVELGR